MFSYSNVFALVISMSEFIMLMFAVQAQWDVEDDYKFRNEIVVVSLIWFVVDFIVNYSWIIGITPLIIIG